jgi:membrane dipeptidase
MREFVCKAAVPGDIETAKAAGRHALYMTGNGIPLTQEWDSKEDELAYVKIFFQLGIRMMHLTYQRRNMIGDGCGETSNAGLSDFGRYAVAEMNRIGVIPDCAHSGWQTSLEAAKVSTRPVVASHSTCAAIHPHIRSKPDEVIQAIVDSGGYIGICCISKFLRGAGDVSSLLDHIQYVTKKFGVDSVAIGTDVAYSSQNSSLEGRKLPKRSRSREPFRSLWPKDDFAETPEMTTSLAWTNWPLFTVGLVQRGYSDDEIRKIIGGNVMRVARESLK